MKTPASTFTLKTRRFHPPLEVTWDGDQKTPPDVLDRPLLVWGASIDEINRFEGFQDASKRSVGKALTEALGIARDIRRTPGGVISDHGKYADRIAAFATAFGSMWGDIPAGPIARDPERRLFRGSLRDWYTELLDLLDAVELKNAIVGKRENRAFRKRLVHDETGERIYYLMHSKQSLFLASKGQTVTIDRPGMAPQTLDVWTIAQGTSRTFAWVTLSTLLETKLNGHINLGLHPTDVTSVAITPSGILPTLFAKVWLDTLARSGELSFVRTCQRPDCDIELPFGAYANKKYCSDRCRMVEKRRLHRLSRAQS